MKIELQANAEQLQHLSELFTSKGWQEVLGPQLAEAASKLAHVGNVSAEGNLAYNLGAAQASTSLLLCLLGMHQQVEKALDASKEAPTRE